MHDEAYSVVRLRKMGCKKEAVVESAVRTQSSTATVGREVVGRDHRKHRPPYLKLICLIRRRGGRWDTNYSTSDG